MTIKFYLIAVFFLVSDIMSVKYSLEPEALVSPSLHEFNFMCGR